MKKNTLLLLLCLGSIWSYSQCFNVAYPSPYPGATFTPATCNGLIQNNIATDCFAGEYSNVNVTIGQTYVFGSSNVTDVVTISSDGGITAVASGSAIVTWISTLTGVVRFYTHTATGCGTNNNLRTRYVICGIPSPALPDYVNLQFPPSITIPQGGNGIVYGQVYEAGLTNVTPNIVGQAPGIQAWVGISPVGVGANTNPNTWTTWIPATWNSGFVGNNDEYQATINAILAPGVYYYATRFNLDNGAYVYGGLNNGFWNATTNPSGVLTITPPLPPANDNCANAIALTPGNNFATNTITGTTLGATTSTVAIPLCPSIAPGGNSDVWYSVVIPSSGTVTVETQASTANPVGDTILVAYSGACGSLAPITCNDDNGSGPYSTISITGTAGTLVYLGVWKWGTTTPSATTNGFKISAYDASLGNNSFYNGSFTYYPNPVKNSLNLTYNQDISSVEVYNLLGQRVSLTTVNATHVEVDMSNLPRAAYIVKVTSNNQVKTIKVIKE